MPKEKLPESAYRQLDAAKAQNKKIILYVSYYLNMFSSIRQRAYSLMDLAEKSGYTPLVLNLELAAQDTYEEAFVNVRVEGRMGGALEKLVAARGRAVLREAVAYLGDSLAAVIAQQQYYALTRYAHGLLRRKGIPLVLEILEEYEEGLSLFFRMNQRMLFALGRNRIRNLLVCSRLLARMFEGDGNRVFLLPVFPGKAQPVSGYRPQHPRLITFCGQVSPDKERMDLLLRAIEEASRDAPDAEYQIVGMTLADYRRAYGEGPGPEAARVTFLGMAPLAASVERVRHSDYTIFYRPCNRRNNTGFPSKLGESFAYGVPVIGTPCSDVAEYVQNGVTGFVAASDAYEDFLAALRAALRTPDEQLTAMHKTLTDDNPLRSDRFVAGFKDFIGGLDTHAGQ